MSSLRDSRQARDRARYSRAEKKWSGCRSRNWRARISNGPYIKFEQKRPSGKHILEVEGLSKAYEDNEVTRNFTASLLRGEKVALMGRNGAGKTTLVNALLANSPTVPESELRKTSGYDGPFVDAGKVVWGHEAAVGYFRTRPQRTDSARD